MTAESTIKPFVLDDLFARLAELKDLQSRVTAATNLNPTAMTFPDSEIGFLGYSVTLFGLPAYRGKSWGLIYELPSDES